jgi:hypothetical protein
MAHHNTVVFLNMRNINRLLYLLPLFPLAISLLPREVKADGFVYSEPHEEGYHSKFCPLFEGDLPNVPSRLRMGTICRVETPDNIHEDRHILRHEGFLKSPQVKGKDIER